MLLSSEVYIEVKKRFNEDMCRVGEWGAKENNDDQEGSVSSIFDANDDYGNDRERSNASMSMLGNNTNSRKKYMTREMPVKVNPNHKYNEHDLNEDYNNDAYSRNASLSKRKANLNSQYSLNQSQINNILRINQQVKKSLYSLTKPRNNNSNHHSSLSHNTSSASPLFPFKNTHLNNHSRNIKSKLTSKTCNNSTHNPALNLHGNCDSNPLLDLPRSHSHNKSSTIPKEPKATETIEQRHYRRITKVLNFFHHKLITKPHNLNSNRAAVSSIKKVNEIPLKQEGIELCGSGSKTQRSSQSTNSNKKSSDRNFKMFNHGNRTVSLIYPLNNQTKLNETVKEIKPQSNEEQLHCNNGERNSNGLSRNGGATPTKTDDMIRYIKNSLDDNLKNMFSFSYEEFLSKESDTHSRKSVN